ncbi:MAG: aldo/keto reductase [Hyphomicrobiaceae bacterium]
MDYTVLGRTDMRVSVAGLGCGGNSRVGLGRGAPETECVGIVRTAIDLGVNFLDTAEAYGTEEIVGKAARFYDRDTLIISTKAILRGDAMAPLDVETKVDTALQRLGMDYVDIFHFHAVRPQDYQRTRDVLAPALDKMRQSGKVKFIGITETGPRDPNQEMIRNAIHDEPWDICMLAYSLLNQAARKTVFPTTQKRKIGTLLMFVVRNVLSQLDNRRDTFASLVRSGQLPSSFASADDPLAFLVTEGGAESVTDAAYRFARHEPGADVVLFGTGNAAHVEENVKSILRPPLAPSFVAKLHQLFGQLTGVGLELPDRVKP